MILYTCCRLDSSEAILTAILAHQMCEKEGRPGEDIARTTRKSSTMCSGIGRIPTLTRTNVIQKAKNGIACICYLPVHFDVRISGCKDVIEDIVGDNTLPDGDQHWQYYQSFAITVPTQTDPISLAGFASAGRGFEEHHALKSRFKLFFPEFLEKWMRKMLHPDFDS